MQAAIAAVLLRAFVVRARSRLEQSSTACRCVPTAASARRSGVLGLLGAAWCLQEKGASAFESKEDEVEDVVDGDTVKLKIFGRCRLIGVDTPETVSPKQRMEGKPPDCFGPEASAFTKNLLPKGTRVKVELDAGPADRYGRSLIYLYKAQDGLFVNGELVKQGYARHLKVKPNVRYDDQFIALEKEAQEAKRGLWKGCTGPAAAASSVGPVTLVTGTAAGSGNPGDIKNCKDFATYDEAKAWFDAYFPLYGDVAKLDGDGDGKPCEKLPKVKK